MHHARREQMMAFQTDQWLCFPPFYSAFLFIIIFTVNRLPSCLLYLSMDFEPPPGTSRLACFSTTASRPRGGPGLSHLGFRGSLASLRTDQRLTGLPRPYVVLSSILRAQSAWMFYIQTTLMRVTYALEMISMDAPSVVFDAGCAKYL